MAPNVKNIHLTLYFCAQVCVRTKIIYYICIWNRDVLYIKIFITTKIQIV